jgi:hypothetical protein
MKIYTKLTQNLTKVKKTNSKFNKMEEFILVLVT